ncbi:hypothetical protein LX32DRAFT_45599 [Colletotrichum zoysiae]|uniref:Uncharacterized protein n=1 Tax=Colletotrichum zoysiae TaxID=1216348 RepID=A0AAD9HCF8_9PEZI|nr:hypothetical protein LX32DRAFT_45599 [Colletotrichum zoysiae]
MRADQKFPWFATISQKGLQGFQGSHNDNRLTLDTHGTVVEGDGRRNPEWSVCWPLTSPQLCLHLLVVCDEDQPLDQPLDAFSVVATHSFRPLFAFAETELYFVRDTESVRRDSWKGKTSQKRLGPVLSPSTDRLICKEPPPTGQKANSRLEIQLLPGLGGNSLVLD